MREELETAGRELAQLRGAPRPWSFRVAAQHPRQTGIGRHPTVPSLRSREFVGVWRVAHPRLIEVGRFLARRQLQIFFPVPFDLRAIANQVERRAALDRLGRRGFQDPVGGGPREKFVA